MDFVHDDIDIALRYGASDYPNLESDFLMDEVLSPVCNPNLMTGPHPLTRLENLKYHELIHDVFSVDWKMWLTAASVENVDTSRSVLYKSSGHGITTAIQGDGVALGRSALVAADLAAGRLVRPFDLSLSTSHAYYRLLCRAPLKMLGLAKVHILSQLVAGG